MIVANVIQCVKKIRQEAPMAWNYERSRKRLAEEWERLQEAGIKVEKLKREMDLYNLSPAEARVVRGVHLYAGIRNFGDLFNNDLMRRDCFKRMHRYLHVVRVEQRRIMQKVFDGDKIQVQGPKFHGLLFKPYDDDETMAWHSVLAAIALRTMCIGAVPQVFADYPSLVPVIGLDLGDSLVANVGVRGDRELISVGSPANHAAKIMGGPDTVTIGPSLYSSLPKKRKPLFEPDGEVYRLECNRLKDPEKLINDEGFDWSIEASVNSLLETLDSVPLGEIVIEEARERIDLEELGPKHAKTCHGASLFVDLDGFTKLVDSMKEDMEKLAKVVQTLHLFRYELRQVTLSDFDGVPIQHQGDRLQALVHLPTGEEDRIKQKAVEVLISYNSSVEDILNKEHNLLGELHVGAGCDFGRALVGRLGVRGDLDCTCIGDATLNAERIQLSMKGNEIGINSEVYEAIKDESIKAMFSYDAGREVYVAKELTWISLEDAEHARAYATSSRAAFTAAGTIAIGDGSPEQARPLKVTRPWGK